MNWDLKHVQRWASNSSWASRTSLLKLLIFWNQSWLISQNQPTLPKSHCRTTVNTTVVLIQIDISIFRPASWFFTWILSSDTSVKVRSIVGGSFGIGECTITGAGDNSYLHRRRILLTGYFGDLPIDQIFWKVSGNGQKRTFQRRSDRSPKMSF